MEVAKAYRLCHDPGADLHLLGIGARESEAMT